MVCPLGQTMKPLALRLSNRSAYTTIGCPLVKCMPGPGLLKPEKFACATAGKTTRTSSDENEATTPRPANERLFEWEDTTSPLCTHLATRKWPKCRCAPASIRRPRSPPLCGAGYITVEESET